MCDIDMVYICVCDMCVCISYRNYQLVQAVQACYKFIETVNRQIQGCCKLVHGCDTKILVGEKFG